MKLKILALLVAFPFLAGAQNKVSRITGRIINVQRKPIAGATLYMMNEKRFLTADMNGNFSIDLSVNTDTLLISHVGYESKYITLKLGQGSPITIILKEAEKQLEEIKVNTGYQELPKERATGSFTKISNQALNLQVGINILERLEGVANGVLFDRTKLYSDNKKLSFNIRGINSINGSQDPLIVLNNFPYDGDINNINPDDVESITILKDASAASIWGTRAGNGVVVITTKKSAFNQPTRIEFHSDMIVTGKPDLYYLPQMNSSDYIDVEQMLFNNGAYNNLINSPGQNALSPAVTIFLNRQKGIINKADSANMINILKTIDSRNEFTKYLYQSAITQQYSLALKGGGSNVAWLISGGYNKKTGQQNKKWDRTNLHLQNIYLPFKNVQVGIDLLYSRTRSTNGKPGYGDITIGGRAVPYINLTDAEGNPLPIDVQYRKSYTDTVGSDKLLNWEYYPLEDWMHNSTRTNIQDIMANFNMQYKITNTLSASFIYQYQKQENDTKNLATEESYFARNLINLFSEIDPITETVNYMVPRGGILNSSENTLISQNLRGQINFSQIWQQHMVVALAGAEIRQTQSFTKGNTAYGYNDELLTTSNTDFRNSYPTYVTGNFQYIPDGTSFSGKNNRFVSYFANAAYTLNKKYTISGSMRKDASNLFGVNTNDKWNPFGSIGLGWNISNENFYHLNFLPFLKFRASYGFSGIVDQSRSAVTVLYYSGPDRFTGLNTAQVNQFGNPDLKWEKIETLNFGIDFSSQNNIFSGSLEYYNKTGTDLFGPSPIDYTAGLRSNVLTKNIANSSSKGVDFLLQTNNISGVFNWKTQLLFNYNLSKTTKYYYPESFIYRPGFGESISPIVGESLYAISSYKWGGLDDKNGNPQGFLNKTLSTDYTSIINSIKSPDSLHYSGSATPKLFGAVANTLKWKRVSLTVNITYKLGYYFRKSSISYDQLFNYGIGHSDFAKRWQEPGDAIKTSVPSMIYPNITSRDQFYLLSEATVSKGDHIRFQFINVSYDIDNAHPEYLFKNFQIYFNASNLGLIWRANKDHIDPDYYSSLYPSKTFAFGIKATF